MNPTRRRVLQGLGLVAAGALSGRLAWLQVAEGPELAAKAKAERTVTWVNRAPRGDITGRDGTVLATSAVSYDLGVNQVKVAQYEQTEERTDPTTGQNETVVTGHGAVAAAAQIAPVLDVDPQVLGAAMVGDSTYAVIAENVAPDTWRQIKALDIAGVEPDQRTRRVYPADTVAGNVLGYTFEGPGRVLEGSAGLEYTQNKVLTGTNGKGSVEVGRTGAIIPTGDQSETPAVPGATVRTTLDQDLQLVAQQAIDAQVAAMAADWGIVVVMEPGTGKLLVLADSGAVNPADPTATPDEARRSRAVEAIFEPGSVGKVVTFATALEEGTVTAEQTWTVPYSWTAPNGQEFHDSHDHETLTLTTSEVLKESSNVGTVQIGDTLDDDVRYRYMEQFGWGTVTGVEMPAESAGMLIPAADWDGRTRYTTMFGQGVATTSLQAVQVLATVANKGVRVAPRVIDAWIDPEGVVTEQEQPENIRVISEATAATLTDMLVTVTQKGGTAQEAAIDGYLVAGKTGTTELIGTDGTVASFAGFLPAKDPAIAVAVVTYHPRHAIYGGEVSGPVFRKVALAAMHSMGIAPDPAVIAETDPTAPTD